LILILVLTVIFLCIYDSSFSFFGDIEVLTQSCSLLSMSSTTWTMPPAVMNLFPKQSHIELFLNLYFWQFLLPTLICEYLRCEMHFIDTPGNTYIHIMCGHQYSWPTPHWKSWLNHCSFISIISYENIFIGKPYYSYHFSVAKFFLFPKVSGFG
jgi:hypothetical protein